MLIKPITYETFDGETITEDFMFNLTKAEVVEMQVSKAGGLDKYIERIIKEKDLKKLVEYFKDLIRRSYGVKSDDGKRFIKNDEIRDAFMQTEAYSNLFMELATDDDAAAKFINGIIPKKLMEEIKKMESEGNITEIKK